MHRVHAQLYNFAIKAPAFLRLVTRHSSKMAKETLAAKHPSRKRFIGLSLEKFAAAKHSTYDKRRRKEREDNIRARKINKYRKLKAKLQRSGHLHATEYPSTSQAEEPETAAEREPEGHPAEPTSSGRKDKKRLLSADGQLKAEEGREDAGVAEQQEPQQEGRPPERLKTGSKKQRLEPDGSESKKKKKHQQQRTVPTQVERLAAKVQAEKEALEKEREESRLAFERRRAQIAAVEKQRKEQSKLFRQKTPRGQPVMKHRINKILELLEKS